MSAQALVTGASEGIGLAFARALAQRGYRVTLVSRSQPKLDAALAQLGRDHRAIAADLSEPREVERICALVRSERFDLLVNNAGAGLRGRFDALELGALQRMVRLDVDAVVALSHAFLAGARAGDALINVASIVALTPSPGHALYSASKALVLSLSEALWFEQRERGVHVMALCPGVTRTNFRIAAGAPPGSAPRPDEGQSPEEVVAEALEALDRREGPCVITGRNNRLTALAARLASRKKLVETVARRNQRSFPPRPRGPVTDGA